MPQKFQWNHYCNFLQFSAFPLHLFEVWYVAGIDQKYARVMNDLVFLFAPLKNVINSRTFIFIMLTYLLQPSVRVSRFYGRCNLQIFVDVTGAVTSLNVSEVYGGIKILYVYFG